MLYNHIIDGLEFVRKDFKSYPLRWVIETMAWLGIVFNTVVITITVPDTPWHLLYPIWIVCCLASIWTSYTRNSSIGVFGSVVYTILDVIGYYRLLT
jgi:hypothetical protein